MEGSSRFVRLVLFFDLPQETKTDQRHYRQFVKYLKTEGFIRIQYSVYAKLCININVNLKMYSFDHLRMYNIDHINTCCSRW